MKKNFDEFFKNLYGIPCWNVQKGHGSFLTFEFGEPQLEIGSVSPSTLGFPHERRQANVRGAWHLWIYMCHWSIEFQEREICHSESEDIEMNRACGFLNGQCLSNIETNSLNAIDFRFDLGGVLKTFPYSNDEIEDMWMLYCPDKRVLCFQSDGKSHLK